MAKSTRKGTKKAAKKGVKTAQKAAKGAKKRVRSAKKPAGAGNNPAHTVTPYLAVGDAAGAIEWYKKALGAKEVARQPAPGGKIMHAHLKLGDSELFLADMFPESDMRDPARTGGTSVNLHVWSRNAQKMWDGAVANGAKVTMPMDDMFWGNRYGKFLDPYGHSWALAWRSNLSKAELERKREQAMKEFAAAGAPPSG